MQILIPMMLKVGLDERFETTCDAHGDDETIENPRICPTSAKPPLIKHPPTTKFLQISSPL